MLTPSHLVSSPDHGTSQDRWLSASRSLNSPTHLEHHIRNERSSSLGREEVGAFSEIMETCALEQLEALIKQFQSLITPGTEEVLSLRSVLRGLIDDLVALNYSRRCMKRMQQMTCSPRFAVLGLPQSDKTAVLKFLLRETCELEKESSPVGLCDVGSNFPPLRETPSYSSPLPPVLHTFSSSSVPRVTIHNSDELTSSPFCGDGEPPGPPTRRGTESPPSQCSPNSRISSSSSKMSSAQAHSPRRIRDSPIQRSLPHSIFASQSPSDSVGGPDVLQPFSTAEQMQMESTSFAAEKKNSRLLPAPPENTTIPRKSGGGHVAAQQNQNQKKTLFPAPVSPNGLKASLKTTIPGRPDSAKMMTSIVSRGPGSQGPVNSTTVGSAVSHSTKVGPATPDCPIPLGSSSTMISLTPPHMPSTITGVLGSTKPMAAQDGSTTSLLLPQHVSTQRGCISPSDSVVPNNAMSHTLDSMTNVEFKQDVVSLWKEPVALRPFSIHAPQSVPCRGSGTGVRHVTPRVSPKVSLCDVAMDHRSQVSGYSVTPSYLLRQGNGSIADFDMDRVASSEGRLRWRTVRPRVLGTSIYEKVLQYEVKDIPVGAVSDPLWLDTTDDERSATRVNTRSGFGPTVEQIISCTVSELQEDDTEKNSGSHNLSDEVFPPYEVPWTLIETDQSILQTQENTPWIPNSIYGDIILLCVGCEDVGKPALHRSMALLFGPFMDGQISTADEETETEGEDAGLSTAVRFVEELEKPSTAPFSSTLRPHSKRLNESNTDGISSIWHREHHSSDSSGKSSPFTSNSTYFSASSQRVHQALATQAIFVLTHAELVFQSSEENGKEGKSLCASNPSRPSPIAHSAADLVNLFRRQMQELFGVTIHEWQIVVFSALTCQAARDVLYAQYQEKMGGEVYLPRSEAGSEMMHLSTSTFMNEGGTTSASIIASASPGLWNSDQTSVMAHSLSGRVVDVSSQVVTTITAPPRGPTLSLAVMRYCDEVYGSGFKVCVDSKISTEDLQALVCNHAKDRMWSQSGAESIITMARNVHHQSATYILSHAATSLAIWAAQLLPLIPVAASKTTTLIQQHHFSLGLLHEKLDLLTEMSGELMGKTSETSTSIMHGKVQLAFEVHAQLFLKDLRAIMVLCEEPREMDLSVSQAFASAYERFKSQVSKFRKICIEKGLDQRIEKLRVEITAMQLKQEQRIKAFLDNEEEARAGQGHGLQPHHPEGNNTSSSSSVRRRGSAAQQIAEASTKKRVSAKRNESGNSDSCDSVPVSTNPASLSFITEVDRARVSKLVYPEYEAQMHELRTKRHELERHLLIAVSQMTTEIINFFEAYVSESIPAFVLAVKEEVVHTVDSLHAARQVLEQAHALPPPPTPLGIHSAQVSVSNLLSPYRAVTRSVNSLASVTTPSGGSSEFASMIHSIAATTFLQLPPMGLFSEFATAFRAGLCEDVIRALAKVHNYRRKSTFSNKTAHSGGSSSGSEGQRSPHVSPQGGPPVVPLRRGTETSNSAGLFALFLPTENFDDCTPEMVFGSPTDVGALCTDQLSKKSLSITLEANTTGNVQSNNSWHDSATLSLPMVPLIPTYLLAKRTDAVLKRYPAALPAPGGPLKSPSPPIPPAPETVGECTRVNQRSSNPRSNMAAMRSGKAKPIPGQWSSPRHESLTQWRHAMPKECKPIRFMEQPTLWVLLDVIDEGILFTSFAPWVQLELQHYADKVNRAIAQLQRGLTEARTDVVAAIGEWEASLQELEHEKEGLEAPGPNNLVHELTKILTEAKRIAANLDTLRDKQQKHLQKNKKT